MELTIDHPPKQDIIQLRRTMKEIPDFPGIRLTFPFPLSEDRQHTLAALKTGVLPENKDHLLNHPDFVIREAAQFTETHGNIPIPLEPFMWLLLSRKPALATPFREQIAQKITGLAQLMQKATDNNPRVIGLIVYGSVDKGYATPQSDIDSTLWVKHRDAVEDEELQKNIQAFSEEGTDVYLMDTSTQLQTKLKAPLGESRFFTGSFFGNTEALREAQLNLLKHLQPRWEQIRETLGGQVTDLQKAFQRHTIPITPLQAEFASHWLGLLRVPPPYEESLQFLIKK